MRAKTAMTPTIKRFICAFPSSSVTSKADTNNTYKAVSFVPKSGNKRALGSSPGSCC